MENKNILITGGAGFIGSHFADLIVEKGHQAIVFDKFTYAGDFKNIAHLETANNFHLIVADICSEDALYNALRKYNITDIVHFAAESHVDRSIEESYEFIQTNVLGSTNVFNAALRYWTEVDTLNLSRLVHVSTDEVFGYLNDGDEPFSETTNYDPSSPYAASKAASDHLARAWYRTYELPIIITNCSNNFGPRQHYEKLIPKIVSNALKGQMIPIYGNGQNIRDWIYVKDHCEGIYLALTKGCIGETYLFGGENEMQNISIAEQICELLDTLVVPRPNKKHRELIEYVTDRKGHDWRYAVNSSKAKNELGYVEKANFQENLKTTIMYYIENAQIQNSEEFENINFNLSKYEPTSSVLDFDSFRFLASQESLSEFERIGFTDESRQGFSTDICEDIVQKLCLDEHCGGAFLDIGCGAGELTELLLKNCINYDMSIVLNDSVEMLSHVKFDGHYVSIGGRFPEKFDEIVKLHPNGYNAILCYSVFHYIVRETSPLEFINRIYQLLASDGVALIGDIPNSSQRKRFFDSSQGQEYNKNFWGNDIPKAAAPSQHEFIDDIALNTMVAHAQNLGSNAYILPQRKGLPFSNRRCDLLIRKL